jgi:hypothetical protein
MVRKKEVIIIQDKLFHILQQRTEEESIIFMNYMVTQAGSPYFIYRLGVNRNILEHFGVKEDPMDWIVDIGFSFVKEMILEGDLTRTSGLITDLECIESYINWRELPAI